MGEEPLKKSKCTFNFLSLLELIVNGDRLLAERNESENVAQFRTVIVVQVVDDSGV